MDKGPREAARRRRGHQLQTDLLDAAWRDLVEAGYANTTMESVAARARTGIAVLYRRWPNKAELIIAAMEHYQASHPVEPPDTGTLRGDLFAALSLMGEARFNFYAVVISTAFAGLLSNTGLSFADLRNRLLSEVQHTRVRNIYKRAHQRGEIDLAAVAPAVLAMPFDLVRHDLLMTARPLKRARIEAILDDLFLPLVQLNVHLEEA